MDDYAICVVPSCRLLFDRGRHRTSTGAARKSFTKDFDLACAVAAGAEMGASQNEQNTPRRDMALRIFIFYLGRLSVRDDSKDWNAIAWSRVAELQQEARSSQMLDRCLNLYNSKTK
jgi:hypothetical protein